MSEQSGVVMELLREYLKMKKIIALGFSIILLITGCGKAPPVTSSPLPAVPTILSTATSIPPRPTLVPATVTVTPIPFPTITLTPTLLPTLSGSGGGVLAFFSMQDSNIQVYLINADGTKSTPLTTGRHGGVEPSWSPDGKKLVFQNDGLWIADIASGVVSSLTTPTSMENRWRVKPAWSPDGEWIAFNNENGTLGDIYLIKPDGTELKRLTYTNDISRDGNLVWSPDSKEIAFSVDRDGNIDIFILNVDEAINLSEGGNQRPLTAATSVSGMKNLVSSWSADGSWIAFSSNRDGNSEIYVMNPDGSNVRRLTDNPAFDKEPAWSPDGKRIAFSSSRNGSFDIYVMSVDGFLLGEGIPAVLRLTTSPSEELGPVWNPVP
jgi:Tol biopolymer transport system component